ncbi:SH3 domain-containing protein [Botrytis cinerea]
MPLGINNPLPSSMASECKKCGKILSSFIDPRQAFGPDKIIPPHVLAQAKGLAIVTVLKAGFIGSGRYGNGVVIARLSDGSWSAPSAIGIGGGGVGGQIGFELTDFVFILNDAAAVRTFSQAGSLTLGGNVSIAAGPIGRNAEAAGAASMKGVAGVFSYSKTKGLFAGVSLEGSAIIERRDANEKLYGRRFTAAELLGAQAFAGQSPDDGIYNDSPVYDERHDDVVWEGRRGSAFGEGTQRDRGASLGHSDDYVNPNRPQRASTWADDIYDRPTNGSRARSGSAFDDDYVYSDTPRAPPSQFGGSGKAGPGRPAAPKPKFQPKTASLRSNEAVAQFTFDADQPGDLGFKKGDVITVTKKTESTEDWWTGTLNGRSGIFPSNYVKMRE